MTTTTPQSDRPIPPQQFAYEAQGPSGQTLRGSLEAASTAAATVQLQSLGLRVVAIAPAVNGKATAPRLGTDDFLLFNQQLAHLTQAGLPVERGLRLIAADLHSGRLAQAANDVASDLEKGASLREAFDRRASQFPPLYARLVDAGVQTGNLPGMLFNLGRHLELTNRLRYSLWRAFAYPVMALVALAVILLFVSTMVLPQFEVIYQDFNTRLPLLTIFVLWLGRVYPYILLIVAAVILVVLAVPLALRLAGKTGYLVDYFLIQIPVVGRVLRTSLIARWCDALRLGIESGLDLPRAITLASDSVASPRLEKDGAALIAAISSGAKPQTFRSYLLPATIPAAIELSAHTGDLASTLGTITRMYQQQAEHRLRLIPVILTPALMIVVAAAIAFTITALFLPLVRLISSVSGGS